MSLSNTKMIDAEDLIKAREILKKEVKSYVNQGFGEVIIYKNLAKKYTGYIHNWATLKKFADQQAKSFKACQKIALSILEKQNEQS
tara:strand:+ start:293 stop:550 length:258 start_codon:yes stop_codon:yes gene_type:complete